MSSPYFNVDVSPESYFPRHAEVKEEATALRARIAELEKHVASLEEEAEKRNHQLRIAMATLISIRDGLTLRPVRGWGHFRKVADEAITNILKR